jgi:hypothetical protein
MLRLRATTLLSLLPAPGQHDAGLRRYVHPKAKAVVSIDWLRVKQSPAGAILGEKFLNTGASVPIPKFPGAEFLDDVDRILISSPGQAWECLRPGDPAIKHGHKSQSNPEASVLETPVLLVVMGISIWQRSSKSWSTTRPSPRYSIQVYGPQGKSAKHMAFRWTRKPS